MEHLNENYEGLEVENWLHGASHYPYVRDRERDIYIPIVIPGSCSSLGAMLGYYVLMQ